MTEQHQAFADVIVNTALGVRPGEKVLVELTGVDDGLGAAVIRAVYAAGGRPFYHQMRDNLQAAWLAEADAETIRLQAEWDTARMRAMDVYIGLRLSDNPFDQSDLPRSQTSLYRTWYEKPVHFETRLPHTRWIALAVPNAAIAQSAGMSTERFTEFYYRCCLLDYNRFADRMKPLAQRLERTGWVTLRGRDVNLRFCVRDMGVSVCRGNRNLPAGEVFTAPVPDSAEGMIRYNLPTEYNGRRFSGVCLELRAGKIVSASCREGDSGALAGILDTDEGSRRIGEFALGTNPFVTKPVHSVLFDEKASGSFHFTPGNAYSASGKGNVSRIHWDMVYRMQPEYGGGEVWFDDVLIQKDGRFLPEDLIPLNPVLLGPEISRPTGDTKHWREE